MGGNYMFIDDSKNGIIDYVFIGYLLDLDIVVKLV